MTINATVGSYLELGLRAPHELSDADLATELGLNPTIDVHDAAGDVVGTQIRHPIQWTPPLMRHNSAPPELGEHTASVLEWLDS